MLSNLLVIVLLGLQVLATPGNQGQALVNEVLEPTSRIRELKVLRPVQAVTHSKEQILGYVKERLAEEYPGESLEEEGRLLKHLGWLPQQMDYRATLQDFVTAQVAGYFDPFKNRFVLASWIPDLVQRPIISHELVHALQHQHFGLKKALKRIPQNDDATIARHAVIEGDASIAMLAYGMGSMEMAPLMMALESMKSQIRSAPTLTARHVPHYMKQSLIFPYTGGLDLLVKAMRKNGWAGVNAMHRNYPVSTEQLLHPDRYPLDKPKTVNLQLKGALGEFEESLRNRFGELGFRFLASPTGERDDLASHLSDGWGGDQFVFVRGKDGKRGLVACVVVDQKAHLPSYRSLVALSFEARYNKPPDPSKATTGASRSDGYELAWTQQGSGLAWVELPTTTDRAQRLLQAAAKGCSGK